MTDLQQINAKLDLILSRLDQFIYDFIFHDKRTFSKEISNKVEQKAELKKHKRGSDITLSGDAQQGSGK